eukprot:5332827-Alexandrium_andersonii.AAC.1
MNPGASSGAPTIWPASSVAAWSLGPGGASTKRHLSFHRMRGRSSEALTAVSCSAYPKPEESLQ